MVYEKLTKKEILNLKFINFNSKLKIEIFKSKKCWKLFEGVFEKISFIVHPAPVRYLLKFLSHDIPITIYLHIYTDNLVFAWF